MIISTRCKSGLLCTAGITMVRLQAHFASWKRLLCEPTNKSEYSFSNKLQNSFFSVKNQNTITSVKNTLHHHLNNKLWEPLGELQNNLFQQCTIWYTKPSRLENMSQQQEKQKLKEKKHSHHGTKDGFHENNSIGCVQSRRNEVMRKPLNFPRIRWNSSRKGYFGM